MIAVELEGVAVRKDDTEILSGVDLRVGAGRVLGIVGASGSGKTAVLRAIAGLDPVDQGTVRFGGNDVTELEPADRDIALVFQEPRLYPRRSVSRNISFPLEVRHDPIEEIRRRVGAEARALHIESLLEAESHELSAGEAQVVQIARALVRAPAVLLLDEPFALVDGERAAELRRELHLIQRGFGVTTVIATNNAIDAMTFTDELAVIEQGRITQIGEALDVYEHPRTAIAASMTGDADVLEVTVAADTEGSWLEHPGLRVRAWAPAVRRHDGRRLQLLVRPEWWQRDEQGQIEATVDRVLRVGSSTELSCRIGDQPVTIHLEASDQAEPQPGDRVAVRLDRYALLDPRDGYAIDLDADD